MQYNHLPVLSAACLALVSCASPGVKLVDSPIADSETAKALANPHRLTQATEHHLENKGLAEAYRRDPAKTILALHDQADHGHSSEDRCALAELCLDRGTSLQATNPAQAMGYYLAAAEQAYAGLGTSESSALHKRILSVYNLSTGAAAKWTIDAGATDAGGVVDGPWKTYRWKWKRGDPDTIAPSYFDAFELADYLAIEGLGDSPRHTVRGVGSAMAGHRDHSAERTREHPFMSAVGVSLPVTATAVFPGSGGTVEFTLHDMLKVTSAAIGGKNRVLSADFTAPVMSLYNYAPIKQEGFKRLLHPEQYMSTCQLDEISPFDPSKIPLVFVHGLASDPSTWIKAVNTVWGDPVLRSRYQVYLFSYPTGFPIGYTSSLLRGWLKRYHDHYDSPSYASRMRQMVLVGHSMGALLANTQIRTSGDELLDLYFTTPLEDMDGLTSKEKETLRHVLVYDANPDIRRVVFMAGPHRGSDIATNPIGKLGTALIHLPRAMLLTTPITADIEGLTGLGKDRLSHIPDSITDLRPDAPQLMATLKEPISPRVTYHSVIGNAHPSKELAESSDTVVPYWSSHLDGAKSEKVVHAKHTQVTKNPDALAEMRRILYLHLGLTADE